MACWHFLCWSLQSNCFPQQQTYIMIEIWVSINICFHPFTLSSCSDKKKYHSTSSDTKTLLCWYHTSHYTTVHLLSDKVNPIHGKWPADVNFILYWNLECEHSATIAWTGLFGVGAGDCEETNLIQSFSGMSGDSWCYFTTQITLKLLPHYKMLRVSYTGITWSSGGYISLGREHSDIIF